MRLDSITVILPTRNEEAIIPAFLHSLPVSIPLIVVDASADSTPELIQALRPERTRILRYPGNISEARQLGADATRTPWLLFTDADVVFAPDYFGRLQSYTGYDVVYGSKLSQGELAGYYRWFTRGQHLLHRLGMPAASGSNLLISRHALLAAGGFDVELPCNEDSEVVWRIKRRGYPVLFAPDLVVYAQDHRRLRQGAVRKTMHSLVRCLLLYFDLMPEGWRCDDWGYWRHLRDIA